MLYFVDVWASIGSLLMPTLAVKDIIYFSIRSVHDLLSQISHLFFSVYLPCSEKHQSPINVNVLYESLK